LLQHTSFDFIIVILSESDGYRSKNHRIDILRGALKRTHDLRSPRTIYDKLAIERLKTPVKSYFIDIPLIKREAAYSVLTHF
jgi:hypothetical protein